MTDELKPIGCPMCGKLPVWKQRFDIGGILECEHDDHYVCVCGKDLITAITAWNRRTEPIGNSDELPIRSEVKTFAEFMEVSLKLNDYKGGWRNKTPDWLMSRLKDEVQDLQAALDFALYNEEKIGECVDVANYAMMIADVLSLRREDAE